MFILLPPSETKASGGTGAPWLPQASSPARGGALSFPSLDATRLRIAHDLHSLCRDHPLEAFGVLGISEKLASEVEANAELFDSPTMPAILRYTGVLYDALDADSLPEEALPHLGVGSALFGVLRANDPIPQYRLSGGTKLPISDSEAGDQTPTMKARWGSQIKDVLANIAEDELIIDLRSGTYQQLGRVPSAITVRVEAMQPDGSRKVVSHFNKHYKGLVARELALAAASSPPPSTSSSAPTPTPQSIGDVADILRRAGMTVELPGEESAKPREITLVVKRGPGRS